MLYDTKNPHGGDIYEADILLDFSANTNPFGTPQGVLEAVAATLPDLHRYPDPYCRAPVAAIAEHEGVEKRHVLCGNGAAELIYAYCMAVRPRRAVELAPTFSEYGMALRTVGCKPERYKLRRSRDFALDEGFLPFLEMTEPEAVFLCNPNNPTGRTVERGLLEQILLLCKHRHIRLFVDECFLDLTDGGESLKAYLQTDPQLFILKAFTKSYGMAGLRLGYGLCGDAALLRRMARLTQPWNISTAAQAAGVAALKEQAFLQRTKAVVAEQRQLLAAELKEMGLWVCPSQANFLLFRGPTDLHGRLKEKKILIRSCDNYCGLDAGWYRIAVRLPEENRQLLAAIREVL